MVSNRQYTIPITPTDASFVVTEGDQPINGSKTFSTTVTCNAGNNGNGGYEHFRLSSNGLRRFSFGLAFSESTGNAGSSLNLWVYGDDGSRIGSALQIVRASMKPSFYVFYDANSRSFTMLSVDPGANSEFVVTEGDQTINGVIQFANGLTTTGATVNGTISTAELNVKSGAIHLGTGSNIVNVASMVTGSKNYTISDVADGAEFVMTEGNQTLNGNKTFNNVPNYSAGLSGRDGNGISFYGLADEKYVRICAAAENPAENLTYFIPDVLANANFVMTEGDQTLKGNKTFGNGIYLSTVGGTATLMNYFEEYSGTFESFQWGTTTTGTVPYRIQRFGTKCLSSFLASKLHLELP
jgi:hypothetical protein